jgi:hypothetical protein
MTDPQIIAERVLHSAFDPLQYSGDKWSYYCILRKSLMDAIVVFRAGNFFASMTACKRYHAVCREFVVGTAYEGCTDQFFTACYSDLTSSSLKSQKQKAWE